MEITQSLKQTVSIFGIGCAAIAFAPGTYADTNNNTIFDDIADFFSGGDDEALNERGPGDHMQSRSVKKEYPQLTAQGGMSGAEIVREIKGSTRPGDHRVSRSVKKEFPSLALDKRSTETSAIVRGTGEPVQNTEANRSVANIEAYRITSESKALPFPENAVPGECYAEVIVPAKFATVKEKVLSQEAATRIDVQSAEYSWVDQKVMIKPAETRLEIVPAEYKTVSEKVLVKPASEKLVSIPATYKTEKQKILVRPATKVWMDGEVEVERPADFTGDVVCLVEKPAEYKTVTRRVIDQPARTEVKTIPAEYKTIQKQVLVSAATTRESMIPAQYETIKVRQMTTPNRTNVVNLEPQYVTVTRQVLSEAAFTKWEKVLCNDSISPQLAWEVEDRLKEEGYNPGPMDGVIDSKTESAIKEFQMANNLPKGGLTPSTLENLGIVHFNDDEATQTASL